MTTSNDKLQLPVKDLNDKEIRLFVLGMAVDSTYKDQALDLSREWYSWVIGKE